MNLNEKVKLLEEVVADLQAENLVQSWAIQTLIADLSNTFDDPNVYLSKMHERLSAGADQIDLSKPAIAGAARFYADAIIAEARKHSKAGRK